MKIKIPIGGSKKLGINSNDFHVSVDWGDGTNEVFTKHDKITHTFSETSTVEITVTGGWKVEDVKGNNPYHRPVVGDRYLCLLGREVIRHDLIGNENKHLHPTFSNVIMSDEDGDGIVIRYRDNSSKRIFDFVGSADEIHFKKATLYKFINISGGDVTINGVTIPNRSGNIRNMQTTNVTLPQNDFSVNTMGGELNFIASDKWSDSEPLNLENNFKRNATWNNLLTRTHELFKSHDVRKFLGNVKSIEVNDHFRIHGLGDFAFCNASAIIFQETANENNSKLVCRAQKLKYTFAGCVNLGRGSSALVKLTSKPKEMIGTLSGMSFNLSKTSNKKKTRPSHFGNNIEKTLLQKLDYFMEYSRYDQYIGGSWISDLPNGKIESVVGFAQYSKYSKPLHGWNRKLSYKTKDFNDNAMEGVELQNIPDKFLTSDTGGNQGISGEFPPDELYIKPKPDSGFIESFEGFTGGTFTLENETPWTTNRMVFDESGMNQIPETETGTEYEYVYEDTEMGIFLRFLVNSDDGIGGGRRNGINTLVIDTTLLRNDTPVPEKVYSTDIDYHAFIVCVDELCEDPTDFFTPCENEDGVQGYEIQFNETGSLGYLNKLSGFYEFTKDNGHSDNSERNIQYKRYDDKFVLEYNRPIRYTTGNQPTVIRTGGWRFHMKNDRPMSPVITLNGNVLTEQNFSDNLTITWCDAGSIDNTEPEIN